MRLKRASARSRSIANWFLISGYADRPSKGIIQAPRPAAGSNGPAQPLNSNNNVRGDMPFDELFGERLQRSLQLVVFLLGPQRCRDDPSGAPSTCRSDRRLSPEVLKSIRRKFGVHFGHDAGPVPLLTAVRVWASRRMRSTRSAG